MPTGTASTERIIDRVNLLLKGVSCPVDIRRNIDVAVDEVCENIREYAYGGETGKIAVDIRTGGNYVELVFKDEGVEFDPLQEERAPLDDGDFRIGGLGIYLFRSIMDSAEYSRVNNENRLRLFKIWNV